MGQVKSYYHSQLGPGPGDPVESQYDIDARENFLYDCLLDEINRLIQDEAELDRQDRPNHLTSSNPPCIIC